MVSEGSDVILVFVPLSIRWLLPLWASFKISPFLCFPTFLINSNLPLSDPKNTPCMISLLAASDLHGDLQPGSLLSSSTCHSPLPYLPSCLAYTPLETTWATFANSVPPLPAKQTSTLVNPTICPQLATEPDWTAAHHLVWPLPCPLGSLQPQKGLSPPEIHPCPLVCPLLVTMAAGLPAFLHSPWTSGATCSPLLSCERHTYFMNPPRNLPTSGTILFTLTCVKHPKNTESTHVSSTQLDQMTFWPQTCKRNLPAP